VDGVLLSWVNDYGLLGEALILLALLGHNRLTHELELRYIVRGFMLHVGCLHQHLLGLFGYYVYV
jgi:hypothetical protein